MTDTIKLPEVNKISIYYNPKTGKYKIANRMAGITKYAYLGFIDKSKKAGNSKYFIFFKPRYLPDQATLDSAIKLVVDTILEIAGGKVTKTYTDGRSNWSIHYE